MENDLKLKLYTVADLREYFVHNRPVDLLTERVITSTRAYATIMNPYATDDTAIVSALFVQGEVAAYTYVIPDEQDGQAIYWNTVLYVDSRYEGRGYGYIVIGQMVEHYGERYFDLDAVPASVGNLKYAGLVVDYVNQYVLEHKRIRRNSLKGKMAYVVENGRIRRAMHSLRTSLYRMPSLLHPTPYTLRYTHYIDDATYAFIRKHSTLDLFHRSQAMLNWILTYPLGQEAVLSNSTLESCEFSSVHYIYRRYAVQIYVQDELVGVLIFRLNEEELYINYLYYRPEHLQAVLCAIAEHVYRLRPHRVFTAHRLVAECLSSLHIFAHMRVYSKSFSHPASFVYDKTMFIQAGDGDNIT